MKGEQIRDKLLERVDEGPRTFKSLDFGEPGEMTLDGTVVRVTPIGPCFLACYNVDTDPKKGLVSQFEEIRREPELDVSQLPRPFSPPFAGLYMWATSRANAFFMFPESVREIDYNRRNESLHLRDWVSIQFYRIGGEDSE